MLAEPGGTVVAFESPRRVPATLAVLAELEPERQVAVCRELTKVHEEIVRGSARSSPSATRARRRKGEVVLVLGPAEAGRGRWRRRARGLDQLRRLVEAGAKPRPAAARSGGADRRQRQCALPGAHRVTNVAQSATGRLPFVTIRRDRRRRRRETALASRSCAAASPSSSRRVDPACCSAAAACPRRGRGSWTWPVRGRGDHRVSQRRRSLRGWPAPRVGSGGPGRDAAWWPRGAGRVRFAGVAGSSGLDRVGPHRRRPLRHLATCTSLTIAVREGDRVSAGQRVGTVGTSGRRSSSRPHLHFGVREAGSRHAYRNPLDFLAATVPRPPAPEAPRGVPVPVGSRSPGPRRRRSRVRAPARSARPRAGATAAAGAVARGTPGPRAGRARVRARPGVGRLPAASAA